MRLDWQHALRARARGTASYAFPDAAELVRLSDVCPTDVRLATTIRLLRESLSLLEGPGASRRPAHPGQVTNPPQPEPTP